MTRGNQREQAREKNAKKLQDMKKKTESGASLAKRKEADADALRAKQERKKEEKAAAAAAGGK